MMDKINEEPELIWRFMIADKKLEIFVPILFKITATEAHYKAKKLLAEKTPFSYGCIGAHV